MVVTGRQALFDDFLFTVFGFFLLFFLASFCRVPEEDVLRPQLAGAGGTQHPEEPAREITALFLMVIIL